MTEEEDVAAWADRLVRPHGDPFKMLEALYEAIMDKPVSELIRLTGKQGEDGVKSVLNIWLEGRKGTP